MRIVGQDFYVIILILSINLSRNLSVFSHFALVLFPLADISSEICSICSGNCLISTPIRCDVYLLQQNATFNGGNLSPSLVWYSFKSIRYVRKSLYIRTQVELKASGNDGETMLTRPELRAVIAADISIGRTPIQWEKFLLSCAIIPPLFHRSTLDQLKEGDCSLTAHLSHCYFL